MKYIISLITSICITALAVAQGVHFEEGTWKEVVAKAKAQNKLIYMDVYTTWCGPCKMMAKNVFPDPKAGEKYNALFINYKIDAEKGEGRDIAKKYAVNSYPTNLYINPNDESIVYRISGACDVAEFINRADIAQDDFKDPMTWEQYQATLKKNPKDLAFVMKYLNKANKLNKSNDEALDIYIANHLSKPVTEEQLRTLYMYTLTLDNKAVDVLFQHKDKINPQVGDPKGYIEEREKTEWFSNTFKKAVDNKSIKTLASMKSMINKYNLVDSIGKWYWLEQNYYNAIQDYDKLLASYKKGIQYYDKFTAAELKSKDAAFFQTIVDDMLAQADFKKMPEAQREQYIMNLKDNPEAVRVVSDNMVEQNMNAAKLVGVKFFTNKKYLQDAEKWIQKSINNIDVYHKQYAEAHITNAMIQYHLKRKDTSIKIMQDLIAQQTSFQKDTKSLEDILTKIKTDQVTNQ